MVQLLKQVVMIGAGIAASLVTFVLVMQYGFGTPPKDWVWILCVYPAGMIVSHTLVMLANTEQ